MIYQITGKLVAILSDSIVVDANGLGYQIIIPASYQSQLPALNNTIQLFTHFHVREDHQTLFGFLSLDEKDIFTKLTSVSGVGPKVAIRILSEKSINELTTAIFSNDIPTLISISGVGKKMAERLIIELKDKLDKSSLSTLPSQTPANSLYIEDLSLALNTLGYSKEETKRLISKASAKISPDDPIEASIKTVLKHI